jgi:sugar diacid utilization regulator
LRQAQEAGRAIRADGRLLALASPREDVLGVLALIDPEARTGDAEKVALEHGATVLAIELARMRTLAETELRLRRDLAQELLAGVDEESALIRAEAMGYDLERRHHVVVVEWGGHAVGDDRFFHAVRRAARDASLGALLVGRGSTVVVLADGDPPSESFRAAVLTEMGEGRCRVGVGGACERPADFPRSYREAQLALKVRAARQSDDGVTAFDQLGIYRLLAEVEDASSVERFVQEWLGALLDYDAARRSQLVLTLARYLEYGGNYDATAKALDIHRSTLKYRLQRIRDISGHDLGVPDVSFNLALAVRAWHTRRALLHE